MPTATVTTSTAAAQTAVRPRGPAPLTVGRRGRPALWGGGLALIAVGAAVATSAALSAGAKHDVLALARPVPAGHAIAGADIRVVRVAADSSLATISASQQATVIGERAAVDLVAGTLLTPKELGGAAIPDSGQALLGIAFKAGQSVSTGSRSSATSAVPARMRRPHTSDIC